MRRKRCYLEVSYGGQQGRIEVELFNDIVPQTAENFRALCVGHTDESGQKLSYKNTFFHRIVRGFIIQGGKISKEDSDCRSIYGDYFPDENLDTPHDEPFLLSMANKGPDTNGSQFFITTSAAPHLDKHHVVFGKVVSGQKVVQEIEAVEVDRSHRPLDNVRVVRCGELVYKTSGKKRSSTSDSRDHKHREENDQPVTKKRSVNDNDGEPHPLVCRTEIDVDEIPVVPENKYLQRHVEQDSRDWNTGYRRERFRSGHTKSGRKIKGRGVFRYRTPSPSEGGSRRRNERSTTPLHWRQAQQHMVKMGDLDKWQQEEGDDSDAAPAVQSAVVRANRGNPESGEEAADKGVDKEEVGNKKRSGEREDRGRKKESGREKFEKLLRMEKDLNEGNKSRYRSHRSNRSREKRDRSDLRERLQHRERSASLGDANGKSKKREEERKKRTSS